MHYISRTVTVVLFSSCTSHTSQRRAPTPRRARRSKFAFPIGSANEGRQLQAGSRVCHRRPTPPPGAGRLTLCRSAQPDPCARAERPKPGHTLAGHHRRPAQGRAPLAPLLRGGLRALDVRLEELAQRLHAHVVGGQAVPRLVRDIDDGEAQLGEQPRAQLHRADERAAGRVVLGRVEQDGEGRGAGGLLRHDGVDDVVVEDLHAVRQPERVERLGDCEQLRRRRGVGRLLRRLPRGARASEQLWRQRGAEGGSLQLEHERGLHEAAELGGEEAERVEAARGTDDDGEGGVGVLAEGEEGPQEGGGRVGVGGRALLERVHVERREGVGRHVGAVELDEARED
mmetsp:Transcript_33760/g.88867  ORF Transcript_33760/g.88867 Transcript_33760/m.88867 type:complete len:342 (-) Transcript_33760:445-1470(-)